MRVGVSRRVTLTTMVAVVLTLWTVAMRAATVATAPVSPDAPQTLAETGLYLEGQPGVVDPRNRLFSPQYPLWSDGAAKTRWVYLPPGAAIGVDAAGEWTPPDGTKFWKEFTFNGRRVETRFIWKTSATKWVFATYVWDADGNRATLAPRDGIPNATEIAPGRAHTIPAVADCAACHGDKRPRALGFNALQLSSDRDPHAIHGEALPESALTIGELLAAGVLPASVSPAARIATSNPRTRAVLGYLAANCGMCHNGAGEIAALGPVLKYRDLLTDGDAVARSLIGQRTKWQVPGVADGESVVADLQAPDRSAMLVRMRSRRPSSQMPPLATVLRDERAIDVIAKWIGSDLVRAH